MKNLNDEERRIWSNLMNKNTELDVVDPKMPRKRKLSDFYDSQSSNDSFYHDQPKKFVVSYVLKPLILL